MRFKQFLNESINDKNIFKAVILAGGPGSGKSFITNKIFSGTGARIVSSDKFFERALKKYNLPTEIDTTNQEIYIKQMSVRSKAKTSAKSQALSWIDGMLPIVIDGTGKNYNKVKAQKEVLESIGYDVVLVFVNTSLDVAQQRNQKRERSLDAVQVEHMWKEVQNNIGKFQSLFKGNMTIIDNNDVLSGKELDKFNLKLAKLSMKLLNVPLQNRTGKKNIEMIKQIKGKYLSDIDVSNLGDTFKV